MSKQSSRVYVGLGSNLNNPTAQACFGLKSIQSHVDISEIEISSLYISPPLISKTDKNGKLAFAPEGQEDYTNAVIAFTTSLSPHQLLSFLQTIELDTGRVRQNGQWGGARTLDLDILCYEHLQLNEKGLTLPHPGIASRACVYVPLLEVNPEFSLNGMLLYDSCSDSQAQELRQAEPAVQLRWQSCLKKPKCFSAQDTVFVSKDGVTECL